MASYHLNVEIVSRGKANSITAVFAYTGGEKLRDDYEGKTHDRSYRQDVIYKEILLPEGAPHRFLDRQTLVNAIDASEKRSDSQMARSIKIALPNELSFEENIALTKEFVTENFIDIGMCADIAIHEGLLDESRKPINIEAVHERQNNPHAHIIVPFRTLGKDGFHKTKTQGRYMNNPSFLVMWRQRWAELQNREFIRLGLPIRVSHESNATRGITQEPTAHIGAGAMALELRDVRTDRGDVYRETMTRNKERSRENERDMARYRGHERVRDRSIERSR